MDWYKYWRKFKLWFCGKPTTKLSELEDFCFTVEMPLKDIFYILREKGWEINYPMQHVIKTKWGTQFIGARKYNNIGLEKDKQYHLRVFHEGGNKWRVYCHREWMPERMPLHHYLGVDCEKNCDEVWFLNPLEVI